ncbi:MAG TPA: YsnF/AvaK domain-containing protein [Nitrososphaeraceae archaeon]
MSNISRKSSSSINWDEVIKKEARGKNDEDLGEVQEIGETYVLTQKGMLSKEKFYIPKYLVEGYDGDKLYFRVSEEEARNTFVRGSAPAADEYSRYKTSDVPADIETKIPVIEERLSVEKRESTQEATITKEPITETKTVEVPVIHEEVTVERRPPTDRRYTSISEEGPVDAKTEVKVPLKHEEVEVTKQPYVKEEVAVKKKPVTETRQVSEEVRSERVDVSNSYSTEDKEA